MYCFAITLKFAIGEGYFKVAGQYLGKEIDVTYRLSGTCSSVMARWVAKVSHCFEMKTTLGNVRKYQVTGSI
jgi:hypothetical protein